MTTATGRFDLTSWDEETYDDAEGATLKRVRNTKSFEGGMTGTSATELLQAGSAGGAAAYVAIERVAVAIDGRKGTFVLRHSAMGSADGGEHTYTFTYQLP